MEIDGFTFVAQIVNFIILLVLLRLTLYKPILNIMQEREENIKAKLNDAYEKYKQAEQEAASLRAERKELEAQRERLLTEARKEAEKRRQELEAQAREQVEAVRIRWLEDIHREQTEFFEQLQRRVTSEVVAITRQALQDLANAELETQIINVFVEQLQTMSEEERRALQDGVSASGDPVIVRSAFEIDSRQRRRIHEALGEDVAVDYALAPELICGVELKTPRYEIAWSVRSYIDSLENNLTEAFSDAT